MMGVSVRRKSNAYGKGRFAKIFYGSAEQNLSHTGEYKANKFAGEFIRLIFSARI